MGVKQLLRFIEAYPDLLTSQVYPLPHGRRAVVLVDSISISLATYAYHAKLASIKQRHSYIHPDTDILGGEAPIFKEACRQVLSTLRTELAMNLILVSDAPRFRESSQTVEDTTRDDVLDQRSRDKEDRIRLHFQYANGQAPSKEMRADHHDSHSFGLPPNYFSAIMSAVIDELNTEALARGEQADTLILNYKCKYGEVDQHIGRLVAEMKADLVISSDTDMALVNHGAPVTLTRVFPWDAFMVDIAPTQLHIPTCTHSDLCRVLGLKVANLRGEATLFDQFLANDSTLLYVAAALCGNDVTGNVFGAAANHLKRKQAPEAQGKGKDKGGKPKAPNLSPEQKLMQTYLKLSPQEANAEVDHRIVEHTQRLHIVRRLALRQPTVAGTVAEGTVADASSAATEDSEAARKFLTELLSHPLIQASTEQYVRSASSEPAEANVRSLPQFTQNLDAVETIFKLYESDDISFLVKFVEGIQPRRDEDVNPYRASGDESHAYHNLKTVDRVQDLTDLMIDAQRLHCGAARSSDLQKRKAAKQGKKAKKQTKQGKVYDGPLPATTILAARDQKEEDRKRLILRVFEPTSMTLAEDIDAKPSSADASKPTELPSAEELALFLIHPALYKDELKVMAAMLAVMRLPKDKQVAIKKALHKKEEDADGDATEESKKKSKLALRAAEYWKSRGVDDDDHHRADAGHIIPSARALTMSYLLSDALGSLQRLEQNLALRYKSSKESPLNGPSFLSTDAIICSYSGSLLHYLAERKGSIDELDFLQKDDFYKALVKKVLERAARFEAQGQDQARSNERLLNADADNKDEIASSSTNEEAVVQEDANPSGYGCRGDSSNPGGEPERGLGWVGMLHRDELADLMDEGGSNIASGAITMGSKRGASDPTRNYVASAATAIATAPTNVAAGERPLPILEHMPKILRTLSDNNVVCIQGETGCGKSSMIPLCIYQDAMANKQHVSIIVTQPRRLAASSLAKRVASLLGEEVGGIVGYRMGGGTDFHCDSKRTCIRFVTVGYLLESLISHPSTWKDVTHFILDEVHERSLDADMLSLVLKVVQGEQIGLNIDDLTALSAEAHRWKAVEVAEGGVSDNDSGLPAGHKPFYEGTSSDSDQSSDSEDGPCWAETNSFDHHVHTKSTAATVRSTAKVLVMSATIQAKLFQTYFSPLMQTRCLAPNIFVGARRFPVKEYFLDDFIEEFPQLPTNVQRSLRNYCAKAAIGDKPPSLRGDAGAALVDVVLASVCPQTAILVFLPGLDEIEALVEQLQTISDNTANLACKLRVFPLHSVVDHDEQAKCMGRVEPNECNIIVSTNIAETSLTIPDVRIVIDAGMSRRMTFDQKRNIRMLVCGWCSKSAAKQRSGRAGRVSNGLVIRMYPRSTFEKKMEDFDPSEFYPLEYSVLQVRHHLAHFGSIEEVMELLIEPPPADDVAIAINRLCKLGALDEDLMVTDFGRVALRMPVDLRMTKGILAAAALGCAAEMVVIVAGLSMQKPLFARPLRVFFDDETSFLTNMISVARTTSKFEKVARSDVHLLMSVFQYGKLSFDEQRKIANDLERRDIASRSVSSFTKSARNIAESLLGLGITLHRKDARMVEQVASGSNKRGADKNAKSREGPIEFLALTNPTQNAILQMAMSSACEGSLALAKSASNGKKKVADTFVTPLAKRNYLPAMAELPEVTMNSFNSKLLTTLLDIRPAALLACSPLKLPHYLSRTIVFKLPPSLTLRIMDELDQAPSQPSQPPSQPSKVPRNANDNNDEDYEPQPSKVIPRKLFIAANSKTVAAYEAVFTKIFSGLQASVTVCLMTKRVVLSVGLHEIGLYGGNRDAVYKGKGAGSEVVVVKNAVRGGKSSENASSSAASATAKTEGDSTTNDKADGPSLQLLAIHPAIKGLIMIKFVHREKKVLVPITLPGLGEPEGDAFALEDIESFGHAYSMSAHLESGQTKCGQERWSAMCVPDAVPLLVGDDGQCALVPTPKTVTHGLVFGLTSFGQGALSAGASLELVGTPLQQLIALTLNDGVMAPLLSGSSNVALLNITDGFIERFANISLSDMQGTSTAPGRLASNMGAPQYGLVAVLAAALSVQLSRSPKDNDAEKSRLNRHLETIMALNPFNFNYYVSYGGAKQQFMLPYVEYKFFKTGTYCHLPDLSYFTQASQNPPPFPPDAMVALRDITRMMDSLCGRMDNLNETDSYEEEETHEGYHFAVHTAPQSAAPVRSRNKKQAISAAEKLEKKRQNAEERNLNRKEKNATKKETKLQRKQQKQLSMPPVTVQLVGTVSVLQQALTGTKKERKAAQKALKAHIADSGEKSKVTTASATGPTEVAPDPPSVSPAVQPGGTLQQALTKKERKAAQKAQSESQATPHATPDKAQATDTSKEKMQKRSAARKAQRALKNGMASSGGPSKQAGQSSANAE